MPITSTTSQGITQGPIAMTQAIRIRSLLSGPAFKARRPDGFSLIELMIVVAIVAILTAIAFPSYQRQVLKSHRTAAKTALLDLAGREERYYAGNNAYPASLSSVGYAGVGANGALQVPNNTNEDYYAVTIKLNVAPATGYVATATPVGNQGQDSCGTYTITDLGVQSATGTSNTGSCW